MVEIVDDSNGGDGLGLESRAWRTIDQLRKTYHKDYYVVARKLRRLQRELIGDLAAAGYSANEAAALVRDQLIGERRSPAGRRAFMASPDALRLVNLGGGEGEPVHSREEIAIWLQALRRQLIAEIRAKGYAEEEAVTLIEEHFIGRDGGPPPGRGGRRSR